MRHPPLIAHVVSGAVTGMAMGWTRKTRAAWPRAGGLALANAAPGGLVLLPRARMIADALTRSPATENHRS